MFFSDLRKKGFTIIELLIVIAIIAILAVLIILSLTGAREEAGQARKASALRQMEAFAEIYRVNNNDSYYNFCEDEGLSRVIEEIEELQEEEELDFVCRVKEGYPEEYCIFLEISEDTYWCTNHKRGIEKYPHVVCPGIAETAKIKKGVLTMHF